VTRLFGISAAWTLAFYLASSFVGAWFWDIGTGLIGIIVFYAVLFAAMTGVFSLAPYFRRKMDAAQLMALGIVLNAVYLALLLGLKTSARHYYLPLALLEGMASSFYWLALFALAASWVGQGQAAWYNAWTGTLEAVLGLCIPPVSGLLIDRLPVISGFLLVFALALFSLLGALVLIAGYKSGHGKKGSAMVRTTYPPLPEIPGWRRLLWSFGALGMRDGLYFLLPNLLLFIVTRSTLVLGIFVAVQSALEGVVFWLLTRWSPKGLMPQKIGTGLSLLALGIVIRPMDGVALFALGLLVGIAYPPYKVALESAALRDINRYSREDGERIQLTGIKEVWINSGRLLSLLALLVMIRVWPDFQLQDLRWILGAWAVLPVMIFLLYRRSVKRETEN
jgi:YQGE family putative transporter